MYDKLILLYIACLVLTKVWMAVLTLIQINRINRAITPEFVLIEPNLPSVNTPLKSLWNYLNRHKIDFNPVIFNAQLSFLIKLKMRQCFRSYWDHWHSQTFDIQSKHTLIRYWDFFWNLRDTHENFFPQEKESIHSISLLIKKNNQDSNEIFLSHRILLEWTWSVLIY